MIRVKGTITMRGNFDVVLDITEEEFENMSWYDRECEVADAIDWRNWTEVADVHDVDVDELDEVKEEEGQ
jgi:hypothetical protein